ncbi:cysteine hydrolase family protein [Pseudovibrio sp. JE062]|uniref:cysteine hydrolase family protein n=1 Tax=Pseudovibrio sp. JE062 TaxID=439495 RepID=UPI000186C498|nr:isochorismatase family cysteine hydrolase [Pseudovibrio sp. JE062]EEA92592.1 isochorismatase family protein [Pseudovibrio sp. JE062]
MVLILVLGVLLALAALAAYTFWGVLKIQTPTNGPSIKSEGRRGTALLIIDVQADFTKETGSRKWGSDYLQSRLDQINALSELAKQKGWPIIAIRHVYQGWYTNFLVRLLGGGLGAQGSNGLQMDPRVTAKPDLDIEKSKSDAFGEQELSAFLKTHQVDHLILTGLDGNACVKNTSIGALNRGYRVELCDPAILAYNQKAWELQKEALQEMGAAVSHDIVENAADAGAEKDPA